MDIMTTPPESLGCQHATETVSLQAGNLFQEVAWGRVLETHEAVCGEDFDAYARLAGKRRWWTDRPFAREALSLGIRGGRALDIGCGPGHVAVYLARLAPDLRVAALDLSPEMLRLTRKHGAAAGVGDRLTTHHGDMCALPFAAGEFDLATSQYAFHHLPRPERALAEMLRVVKPGGAVMVRDLLRPSDGMAEILVRVFGGLLGYDRAGREQYRDSLKAGLDWARVQALARCAGLEASARALSHFVIKGRVAATRTAGDIGERSVS